MPLVPLPHLLVGQVECSFVYGEAGVFVRHNGCPFIIAVLIDTGYALFGGRIYGGIEICRVHGDVLSKGFGAAPAGVLIGIPVSGYGVVQLGWARVCLH